MRVNPTDHPQYDLILSISAAVLEAERDMDRSIATLSKLVGTTVEEFAEAELPGAMAQRALDKLSEALNAHVASRRLLVEAHAEYGRTARSLGASPEAWGPWWPCPKAKTSTSKRTKQPLRVVA